MSSVYPAFRPVLVSMALSLSDNIGTGGSTRWRPPGSPLTKLQTSRVNHTAAGDHKNSLQGFVALLRDDFDGGVLAVDEVVNVLGGDEVSKTWMEEEMMSYVELEATTSKDVE